MRRGPVGSFITNYVLEPRWDLDVGAGEEMWGQWQAPSVPGSGTRGLRGITGSIGFVDNFTDGMYRCRGFVRLS